jgi:hypothetical protein
MFFKVAILDHVLKPRMIYGEEVMNTKVLRLINIYKLMANPNVNNDFGSSLLGIIQTYISNLQCNNSNYIVKCSDCSTN